MMPVRRDQNWLPSIFNDFFGDDWLPLRTKQQAAPAVNIIEHEKSYCIEVAAPGMCKEDFTVRLENDNQLVISLEKRSENEPKPAGEEHAGTKNEPKGEPKGERRPTYLRRDFTYSSFRQSFLLPDEIDCTKIDAKMHHGVLTIELPKREVKQETPVSRQIEIR